MRCLALSIIATILVSANGLVFAQEQTTNPQDFTPANILQQTRSNLQPTGGPQVYDAYKYDEQTGVQKTTITPTSNAGQEINSLRDGTSDELKTPSKNWLVLIGLIGTALICVGVIGRLMARRSHNTFV